MDLNPRDPSSSLPSKPNPTTGTPPAPTDSPTDASTPASTVTAPQATASDAAPRPAFNPDLAIAAEAASAPKQTVTQQPVATEPRPYTEPSTENTVPTPATAAAASTPAPAPASIATVDGNASPGGSAEHTSGRTRLAAIITSIVLLVGAAGGAGVLLMQDRKAAKPADETSKLKVGVMMAFSGGSSSMGYGAMKGINLAKKQLNVDNIEIIQVDSKCEAKSAAAAVKQLIAQNVVAIIGEGCSSATVAALPAANNAKVVMISPSASSPTLSIPNDYFFRVVPPDTLQGSFMADYIYNKGIRNVAAFYTDEPYGSGMNQVFREKFEALGGKIVGSASAEPDVIKLESQVKTIKDASPQAVFIAPNSVVSATAIIKLLREGGVAAPLYGADIMYDTTIIQNGGAAAEGLTISSFPTGTKSFKQALNNENKKTEQLYAAPQAYDIIHVLQLVAEKGAKSGEDIKQILPEISFEGVSGPILFDRNGEISNKDYKYDLFTVKNGEFVVQE